jgi:hypothetical protein
MANPATCVNIGRQAMNSSYENYSGNYTSLISDDFSPQSLTRRIDNFRRMYQLNTLERAIDENHLLKRKIVENQKIWCKTVDLFEEARQGVLLLQRALKHYIYEIAVAEQESLIFWHVKDGVISPNYAPGWI